jgi:hypothetical protein
VRQPQAGDAAELVVEPNFQILRRYRRPLLLRWNTLTDQPWKIMSIARRDWAAVGAKTIR